LNQLTRCALVPCVNDLGNDHPLRLPLQRVVADLRGRVERRLDVAGSRRQPFSFCERAAQTPAKQSACSSTRTLSAFACAAPLRPRNASTLSMMPSWFWMWWPTSWATTYAWANWPGAPRRCSRTL
jgi:hypothetical protein